MTVSATYTLGVSGFLPRPPVVATSQATTAAALGVILRGVTWKRFFLREGRMLGATMPVAAHAIFLLFGVSVLIL